VKKKESAKKKTGKKAGRPSLLIEPHFVALRVPLSLLKEIDTQPERASAGRAATIRLLLWEALAARRRGQLSRKLA